MAKPAIGVQSDGAFVRLTITNGAGEHRLPPIPVGDAVALLAAAEAAIASAPMEGVDVAQILAAVDAATEAAAPRGSVTPYGPLQLRVGERDLELRIGKPRTRNSSRFTITARLDGKPSTQEGRILSAKGLQDCVTALRTEFGLSENDAVIAEIRGRLKEAAAFWSQESAAPDPFASPHRTDGSELFTSDGRGIFHNRRDKEGNVVPVRLANFQASIVEQYERDDGSRSPAKPIYYAIRAEIEDEARDLPVMSRSKFETCAWIGEQLPSQYRVDATVRNAERLLVQAIAEQSGSPPLRTMHTCTGWRRRRDNPDHGYLHAGGMITRDGLDPTVRVELMPPLDLIDLPAPPSGAEAIRCVDASLRLMEREALVPAYLAFWASLFGWMPFSTVLVAGSGSFKSEALALLLQHMGASYSVERMHAKWTGSSFPAISRLMYACKDAPLIVDDFCPQQSPGAQEHLFQLLESVSRHQASGVGRAIVDMTGDGSGLDTRNARGSLMTSAEFLPGGDSMTSRHLTLPLAENDRDSLVGGDVPRTWLTEMQQLAPLFAGATSVVVQAMASGMGEIFKDELCIEHTDAFKRELADMRDEIRPLIGTNHPRAASNGARILVPWRRVLALLVERQIISQTRRDDLWGTGAHAVMEALTLHGEVQRQSEPAELLVSIVRTGLAKGKLHVTRPDGGPPHKHDQHFDETLPADITPGALGWHLISDRDGDRRPQGEWCGILSRNREGDWLLSVKPDIVLSYAKTRPEGRTLPDATRLGAALHSGGWTYANHRTQHRVRIGSERELMWSILVRRAFDASTASTMSTDPEINGG